MEINKIPVVVAFTPNYFVPACVSVLSVLKNGKPKDQFHFFCLLSEPIDKSSQDHLQEIIGVKGGVTFIDLKNQLSNIYVDNKYTIAASYRLLLPDLLPEYNKVLYMDCDMIIQNDIAKLFRETDLGNNYMAGVMEASLPEQVEHLTAIECKPGEYMNSGFLLMNLQRLRADNMVSQFLEASENDTLEFPDQDVINMLCKGKLLPLKPLWNSIRTFLLPQYKNVFLKHYSAQDWKDVQLNGNVHYTGPKPWNAFTVKFDLWWNYYTTLAPELQKMFPVNRKIYLLYRIYNLRLGKFFINESQSLYRKITSFYRNH